MVDTGNTTLPKTSSIPVPMKQFYPTYFLPLLLLLPTTLPAQLFTRIDTGAIATTPSDSRSVNFVDVNNDGWEDLFISNGKSGGQDNHLYLNQGNVAFLPDTANPITQDNSSSVGASFADWDNDGDLDAHVTNWYGQTNQWYENDGTGQLVLSSLFLLLPSHSEAANWGDYDGDGLVDLYVTNSDGNRLNFVFHNEGNGVFTKIDTGAWLTETDYSRNVNWTDYDLDGDVDLFVSNEANAPNDWYRNDSSGSFNKILSGPIVNTIGSSMSSSWADVDNDGDLDLFVANAGYFQEQNNRLYLQEDTGFVLMMNDPVSTDGGCSYGSNFGDYDNDGDLDLIVSNGYCGANLANFLYENQGDGSFVRADSLLPNLPEVCSYGAAWGDLNNDGFLDLMIANCKNSQLLPEPNNSLYLNNGNGNRWLKIKLEGVQSNRSAIGATVRIKSTIGGQLVWQLRQISAQSGYSGQNSLIVHVGLGDALLVDSVLIDWPSGIQDVLTDVESNQLLHILEDSANPIEENRPGSGSIQCFPNPAEHMCRIEIQLSPESLGQMMKLQLLSVLGKEVWRKHVSVNETPFQTNLDLQALAVSPGIYWLRASSEDGILTRKIMVL